jgi:hypothetical protein
MASGPDVSELASRTQVFNTRVWDQLMGQLGRLPDHVRPYLEAQQAKPSHPSSPRRLSTADELPAAR